MEFSAGCNCANQPYSFFNVRPLALLVHPECGANSGSQVRAIILGLVPILVSSCGIQFWGPDLGSSFGVQSLGTSSGVQFWGPFSGSSFWGQFLGSSFGVQFWGWFLGSRFGSICGVDFWGSNEILVIFLIRPNSRAQFWHPKVGPNMDQKLGPRKGFKMGLQIWHPKDWPDLTPQKWSRSGPQLRDQIWLPNVQTWHPTSRTRSRAHERAQISCIKPNTFAPQVCYL